MIKPEAHYAAEILKLSDQKPNRKWNKIIGVKMSGLNQVDLKQKLYVKSEKLSGKIINFLLLDIELKVFLK